MLQRRRAAEQALLYASRMCRNIRTLHNFEPPAKDGEVHDAALQYVRKISGTTKPSQANAEVFERAVEEIAHATQHLLDGLVSSAPPKSVTLTFISWALRRVKRCTLSPDGKAPQSSEAIVFVRMLG